MFFSVNDFLIFRLLVVWTKPKAWVYHTLRYIYINEGKRLYSIEYFYINLILL